jgi:ABC-type branched-subunit amino acid transport system substrate-binding protein
MLKRVLTVIILLFAFSTTAAGESMELEVHMVDTQSGGLEFIGTVTVPQLDEDSTGVRMMMSINRTKKGAIEVELHAYQLRPDGTARRATMTTEPTNDILIGGNFELTGGVASYGVPARNGTILAIEHANAQDALGGRRIKLIEADNKSDNAETTNMATQLVFRDRVVAMLGPAISSNAIAAGYVAQKLKVPMLTPTATVPDVTKVGEYVFRSCFMDDFQATAMADFAYTTLKSRKVAMLVNIALW